MGWDRMAFKGRECEHSILLGLIGPGSFNFNVAFGLVS